MSRLGNLQARAQGTTGQQQQQAAGGSRLGNLLPQAQQRTDRIQFESDIGAFSQGKLDRVQNLQRIVRMLPQIKESGTDINPYLQRFADHAEFRDVVTAELGETWYDDNYEEPDRPWYTKGAAGVGLSLLETLTDPFEGVATAAGLQFLDGENRHMDGFEAIARGLGSWVNWVPGVSIEDPGDLSNYDLTDKEKLYLDPGQDGVTPFDWILSGTGEDATRISDAIRSIPGAEQNLNPLKFLPEGSFGEGAHIDAAGITDLVTQALVDPATYITLGTGAKARAALRGLADEGRTGTFLSQAIRRNGWNGLTEVEQATARSILRDQAQQALDAGGRLGQRRVRSALPDEALVSRAAKHAEETLQRRGQGGVFFNGLRVPGTGRFQSAVYRSLRETGVTTKPLFRIGGEDALLNSRGKLGTVDPDTGKMVVFTVEDGLDAIPGDELQRFLDMGPSAIPRGLDVAEGMTKVGEPAWLENLAARAALRLHELGNINTSELLRISDDIIKRSRTTVSDEFADALTRGFDDAISINNSRNRLGLAGNRFATTFNETFRPRANFARRRGADASSSLAAAGARVRPGATKAREEIHRRLGALGKRVERELGDEFEAFNSRLLATVESAETLDDALVAARGVAGGGSKDVIAYARAVAEISDEIRTTADAGNVAVGNRFLTRKAESAILRADVGENPREYVDNLIRTEIDAIEEATGTKATILQVNEAASRILGENGLKIEDVFETTPERILSAQAHDTLRELTAFRMADAMMDVVDDSGNSLARTVKDKFEQLRLQEDGWVEVHDLGTNGKVMAQRDLAAEIEHVQSLLNSASEMSKFGGFISEASNWWAGFVTSSLLNPRAIAFNMRNAFGNMMNAYYGGLRNPAMFAETTVMQGNGHKVRSLMEEAGVSFDEALARVDMSDRHRKMLKAAYDEEIIGTSFFVLGLDETGSGRLREAANTATLMRPGRKLSTGIENNARLALFMDAIDKGMSPKQAGLHTRKYLFDYGDLTPFEHRKIRTASRFYTFMRKNMGLQMETLIQSPGKITNGARIVELYTQALYGPESALDAGENMPFWMRPQGGTLRGNTFVSMESPFMAFGETVEALYSIGTLPPPIRDAAMAAGMPDPGDEAAKRALSVFSGAPANAIKYLYESATGTSSFTGAPLRDDTLSEYLRFLDVIIPPASAFFKTAEQFDLIEAGQVQDDQQVNLGARMMSYLSGANVYMNSQGYQDRELNYFRIELDSILDEAESQGFKVPSMDDLEEAGKVDTTNRLMQAVLYAQPEEGETIQDAQLRAANELLPSAVADLFDVEKTPRGSGSDGPSIAERLDLALQILEMNGVEPTQEQLWHIATQLPGAPSNSVLEEQLGLQGYQENRFLAQQETELERTAREAQEAQDAQRFMDDLQAVTGLVYDEVALLAPVLSDAEAIVRDARAAGLSEDETRAIFMDEMLSRTDQAYIWGPDSVDQFKYERYTHEDAAKDRDRAHRRYMEITVANELFGLGMSNEEFMLYTYWGMLSKSQQESLGLPTQPSIPGREDLRSDAEVFEDNRLEFAAINDGIRR